MSQSINLRGTPDLSIIVVNESFPNENFDRLLESTNRLTPKHEIILVTCHIEKIIDVEKRLTELLDLNPRLVKVTIILISFDKGPSQRRNIGAVLACSSNLLFADDDSAILDDLTPLLEYLRSGEFQGVQPLILRLRNDNIIDSSGDFVKKRNLLYYPYSRGSGTKIQNLNSDLYLEEIPSMRSAFMMVRKDAFLAVGGFDETFNFNFEDVDIGWRLTCAGYGLLFIPTVKALHKGGRTTGERDEESYRLLLLNFHAVQLKFVGFPCWPWIFSRFLALMSVYEFAGIWRRNKGVTVATRNLAIMIALFLERFKQALYYRRLLSEVFHLKGRKKLEAMARGKRFIHSLT